MRPGLLAALALVWAACNPRDEATAAASDIAAPLAENIEKALSIAGNLEEPHHCARSSHSNSLPIELSLGGRTFTRRGATLIDSRPQPTALTIGVIGDAQGFDATTASAVKALVREFAEAEVDVVVVLGGITSDTAELQGFLAAVARPEKWIVVAAPGDRESIPTFKAAVISQPEAVVDATRYPFITMGDTTLGVFSGAASLRRLGAGSEGCVHTRIDADAFASQLASHTGIKVWLSQAPPRQSGTQTSDLTIDGIHIGSPLIAGAIASARPDVIIHGAVHSAPARSGTSELPAPPIAAGAADPIPRASTRGPAVGATALVATISATRLQWRRIEAPRPLQSSR